MGALLSYYATQLAGTPDDDRHHRQRLILLRNQALLQVLYATAGRASEVAQLARANVKEGEAAAIGVVGKGGKPRPLLLTEAAQKAIRAYLKARDDHHAGLFISHGRASGEPLTTPTIWRVVNEAARVVFGVDTKDRQIKRVGPHAFRHLRAQNLSEEGMPITSLQAFLGHASIATTRDVYAPRRPDEKLLDELRSYGLDLEEVTRQGKKKVELGKR